MTSKHTPGPWTVSPNYIASVEGAIFGDGKLYTVANCGGLQSNFHPDLRDIQAANARLISAAPDLLSVCVQIYGDAIEGLVRGQLSPELLERLAAAIAKAEGK